MSNEVHVPDIGEFEDVEIIELHVSSGDTVEAEDPLVTLETDKASMDVPAPSAGRVAEMKVKKGDRVSAGDLLLLLESDESESPEKSGDESAEKESPADAKDEPEPERESAPEPEPEPEPKGGDEQPLGATPALTETVSASVHAGPSVRKFAREMGVDLGKVKGSGVKGRITHEDVKVWVKKTLQEGKSPKATTGGGLPPVPEIDFSRFGPTEVQALSRVQKISGPRLHASWVNLPHVTQFDEADIGEMEKARKALKDDAGKEQVKLTPLAFILRACVKGLREFPQFNASLHPEGKQLIVKRYYNVGFAVDTPGGLVVPVIKDLEGKSLFQVARELGELSAKARDGKLTADEMQGGNFTISSLGSIGGTFFTPVINAPEVAILGVSRHKMQPVWQDGEFVPRLMLPLSLSYDHRVIDGAAAVRFTRFLAEIMSDVDRLLA